MVDLLPFSSNRNNPAHYLENLEKELLQEIFSFFSSTLKADIPDFESYSVFLIRNAGLRQRRSRDPPPWAIP